MKPPKPKNKKESNFIWKQMKNTAKEIENIDWFLQKIKFWFDYNGGGGGGGQKNLWPQRRHSKNSGFLCLNSSRFKARSSGKQHITGKIINQEGKKSWKVTNIMIIEPKIRSNGLLNFHFHSTKTSRKKVF